MSDNFEYERFTNAVAMCREASPHACVVTRSLEEAEALAAWCVENGIEEPEIIVSG